MVLGMPFLTLSNAEVQFVAKKLTLRSYITAKALPTTKRGELIDKKEFGKAALGENFGTFVVHVVALDLALRIYPDKEAQIVSYIRKKSRFRTSIWILPTSFQKKKP